MDDQLTFDPETADAAAVEAWIECGLLDLARWAENAWRYLEWCRRVGRTP